MKKIVIMLAAMLAVMPCRAQEDYIASMGDGYVWPDDPAVLESLEKWQDMKFGVLFHWGLYSIPGIVESWNLCNEDWVVRPEGSVYEDYKKWYWGLSDQFNPVSFDPDQWAEVAQDAGMKYMIFTTKHHDGYCLFDSRQTDFKITSGPFGSNPKSDAALWVFDAFRRRGFGVGAYFSKPDWHHHGFWNPYYATPDRHPNYDTAKHPDWWQSYVDYTRAQLGEIVSDYGRIDILWLDGGWIRGEQVGIDDIIADARSRYPGMIAVDRTIKGKNENYQTPERSVPDAQIDHPWESCIPLSNDWGWVPDAPYKSWDKVVGQLVEIVAKGGCLVLGVGPTAEGVIEQREVDILHRIGEWLRANGEAIYSTRPTDFYRADQGDSGVLWFTRSKDGKTIYGTFVPNEGASMPSSLSWEGGNLPSGKVRLLDGGRTLRVRKSDQGVTLSLPKELPAEPFSFSFVL